MTPSSEEPKQTDPNTVQNKTLESATYEVGDQRTYPDGGRKALSVLFGCACGGFAGLTLINCPGSFQSWISQHQLAHESPGRIGWIFGFFYFMSFFAGIQTGPIFDAYGPRILSIVGSIFVLLTFLMLGLCTQYWHFFLTIGLCGGIGTSIMLTCAIGVTQHWFFKYRGIATGAAISGGSIGAIVFPLILQSLLPKIGFAWTTRVIALLVLPFLITACILLEARFSSSSISSSWKRLFFNPKILKPPEILLTTIGIYFLECGLFIVLSYISSYALDQGVSFKISYQLLTYLNAGSIVGRWLPGYVGDRIGRFNAQIISLSLCVICVLGIWLPVGTKEAPLIVFSVLFGIASGSNLSLAPVCVSQLCEIEMYGRTYTAAYTIASIGSLTGTPIAGEILQASNGRYLGLILFSGVSYVISLICFVSVRVMKVGWSIRVKY